MLQLFAASQPVNMPMQAVVVGPHQAYNFHPASTTVIPTSLALNSLFAYTPFQDLGGVPSPTAKGNTLAAKSWSIASSRGTIGSCYSAVADAVDAIFGRFLSGNSAYMAADQLASNGQFNEITGLSGSDLPNLPAGAIVVWGKTSASPDGHISVAHGDGQESSDHTQAQM